jgi:glutamine synthetase
MEDKKICLEYIWIDAYGNLRSKLKVVENTKPIEELMDEWNFDGSSTGQATGTDSDIILRPVSHYPNQFISWTKSYLVLCECLNKDGSPHITNHRVKCKETAEKYKEEECLFGIEQEYVIYDNKLDSNNNPIPHKWFDSSHPFPNVNSQGPFYCGVGGNKAFGREITLKHLKYCMDAGLKICGVNAEVMPSQWEYQIGPLNPLEVSDQLWVSRYILERICEEFNCWVSFHPKPLKNYNGSGGHTNFSTKSMRNPNGLDIIKESCEKLKKKHEEHMEVYGLENKLRLCGEYETSNYTKFSWGISDRGCSIRIPLNVNLAKCGYLEDRRPASNLNPYLVTEIMIRTICGQF